MSEPRSYPNLAPGPRRPSATRAASIRRARRSKLARDGNVNAMSHGARADVVHREDVSLEVALTFATHRFLDPVADLRLVEHLALSRMQHAAAIAAMQTDGLTSTLTSYETKLATLIERLEQQVHDRDRQREAEAASTLKADDLAAYRPRSEPA